MDEDRDKELIANLKNLASGSVKKLKANDANILLVRIIQAIIIDDDSEETINSTITNNEHESDGEETETENDGNDITIVSQSPVDPLQGTSKQGVDFSFQLILLPPYSLCLQGDNKQL